MLEKTRSKRSVIVLCALPNTGILATRPPFWERREFDENIWMIDANDALLIVCQVDEVPLSRPKKNIARDFADGGNALLPLRGD